MSPPAYSVPGKIALVFNPGSGGVTEIGREALLETVRQHFGDAVHVREVSEGASLKGVVKDAAESDADTVIAAGGDGTISGVASVLAGTDKALGVIPLGTFNFFAKRLGIPLELEVAVQTIANGSVGRVSVGEVNGRVFLNKSSVGLYPLAVRYREKMYKRFGRNRLVGVVAGAAALLRRGHVMKVSLAMEDEEERQFRTRFIFVCNNPQELEKFDVRGRECLEQGKLAVYLPDPLTPLQMIGLGARMMFGRLREAGGYHAICAGELRLDIRRSRVPVSIDGEVEMFETPLTYRIRPEALRVLVPKAD
jgi:diacylglycerol kinase family enzyme